jgi:hypothetical protein
MSKSPFGLRRPNSRMLPRRVVKILQRELFAMLIFGIPVLVISNGGTPGPPPGIWMHSRAFRVAMLVDMVLTACAMLAFFITSGAAVIKSWRNGTWRDEA